MDDELSAAAYDLIQAARGKDYAGEAAQVAAQVRERCPHAASLLDVACGTGRHLVAFRDLGFDVAGVELSAAMLAAARRRLPGVELQRADMRTFRLGRAFDAVVCLFSSIGYMTTVEDLRRAVATMAAHVAPGGVLVVEPWFAPDGWRTGAVRADAATSPRLAVTRVNRSGRDGPVGTMEMRYAVATPDRTRSFVEHHRMGLYTRDTYVDALRRAGLAVDHDPAGPIGRGLYVATKR